MGWLSKLFGGGRSEPPTGPAPKPAAATREPTPRPPPPKPVRIEWRKGSYPTGAVGESHYQAALFGICGGHTKDGHRLECQALLVPEPTNRHDPNAVLVEIRGRKVGYLPREEAVRLKEALAEAGLSGPVHCAARIDGGFDDDGYKGHFGVRLGIPKMGKLPLV